MTEENKATSSEGKRKHTLSKKKKISLIVVTILLVLTAIVWFSYWLLYGRFYVSTQDAYVHGNQMQITSQVVSGVKAIYAEETDFVEAGQLIVEMENSNYILSYQEAKENLANTVRDVAELFKEAEAKRASLEVQKANYRLALLELSFREGLVLTGAISVEEFEVYKTQVETAEAKMVEAQEEFGKAGVKVEKTSVRTHPRVLEAATTVRERYLDLIRCRVLSPVSGYVAKRQVQVGDFVNAGKTIMMVVPLDYLWMEANFKETKLGKVRVGQPVSFYSDLHGSGARYHGHIVGYQAGTGTAFSILPAQNASGNWIKIVQRVPIRVNIPREQLEKYPLVIGLSLNAKVDIHNTELPMLTPTPTFEPIYHTEIYQTQMEQMEMIEPVIETIIETNLPEEFSK